MAANWNRVAKDMGTGLVAGGVDSYLQEQTDKQNMEFNAKPANAGKQLSIMKQYSTYYNYGLPIVAVVAEAMGWLRDPVWQIRAMTAAGGLVGRKAGSQLVAYVEKTKDVTPWRAYGGEAALAAAEAARAAQAAGGRFNTQLAGSRGSL